MKNSVLVLFLIINSSVFSQTSLESESTFTSIFALNYKANFSGGTLAKRWGFTNTIGADVDFKFKNGLTFGVDGGFIFGNTMSLALEYFPNNSGVATAVIGVTQFLIAGIIGFIASYIHNGDLAPIFILMSLTSITAVLFTL